MRFCYTLVQYSTTIPADEILQTIAKHSVIFEGHQSFAVLPTLPDIFGSTVLTLCNR